MLRLPAFRCHRPDSVAEAVELMGENAGDAMYVGGGTFGTQAPSVATCVSTRCTYYNQTAFWREALGYCLKKDGTVCHVTKVGKKRVAAHSADTPPVLMTLDAVATLVGPEGERSIPVRDFFVTMASSTHAARPTKS